MVYLYGNNNVTFVIMEVGYTTITLSVFIQSAFFIKLGTVPKNLDNWSMFIQAR